MGDDLTKGALVICGGMGSFIANFAITRTGARHVEWLPQTIQLDWECCSL